MLEQCHPSSAFRVERLSHKPQKVDPRVGLLQELHPIVEDEVGVNAVGGYPLENRTGTCEPAFRM